MTCDGNIFLFTIVVYRTVVCACACACVCVCVCMCVREALKRHPHFMLSQAIKGAGKEGERGEEKALVQRVRPSSFLGDRRLVGTWENRTNEPHLSQYISTHPNQTLALPYFIFYAVFLHNPQFHILSSYSFISILLPHE